MEKIPAATIEYWGIVATAITAFVMFWVKLKMNTIIKRCWVSTLGRRSHQHSEMKEQMSLVIESLADIQGRVSPNGGGAIPDALNRIEARQCSQIAKSNAIRYSAKEATFETDLAGSCTETNRAHSRLTGFGHEEMLGDGWINAVAPSARVAAQAQWDKAVSEGREFSEDILYVRPNSRREYLVHVTAFRQLDDEGTLHGYHGIVELIEEPT